MAVLQRKILIQRLQARVDFTDRRGIRGLNLYVIGAQFLHGTIE